MLIQNTIFETNVGYQNTELNLEVRSHIIRRTSLRESPVSSNQRLIEFSRLHGRNMLQGKDSKHSFHDFPPNCGNPF